MFEVGGWLWDLQYYAEEHQTTILLFVALGLILYALIEALRILRRIAAAVEKLR